MYSLHSTNTPVTKYLKILEGAVELLCHCVSAPVLDMTFVGSFIQWYQNFSVDPASGNTYSSV